RFAGRLSDRHGNSEYLVLGDADSEVAHAIRAIVDGVSEDSRETGYFGRFEILVELGDLFVVAVNTGNPERLLVVEVDGYSVALLIGELARGAVVVVRVGGGCAQAELPCLLLRNCIARFLQVLLKVGNRIGDLW